MDTRGGASFRPSPGLGSGRGVSVVIDDQNEAWRRLTDARLKTLEAAVVPRRVRRKMDGKPLPGAAFEPGDRRPLTKWLELRVLAIELILRIWLDADENRAEDLDVDPMELQIDAELDKLDRWSRMQLEPDFGRRETMEMILQARVILMETHSWPLLELEELGL